VLKNTESGSALKLMWGWRERYITASPNAYTITGNIHSMCAEQETWVITCCNNALKGCLFSSVSIEKEDIQHHCSYK